MNANQGGHVVTLAVTLNHPLDDDTALNVARQWATGTGLTPGMTSWDADRRALRVTGMTSPDRRPDADPSLSLTNLINSLTGLLRETGATITGWDAVEVLSAAVAEQRLARRALPPTVTATEFAALAAVTPSRIRQLASQRARGARDDFPHPLLDGHWLRSEAEHWATTRRTSPGPAPGSPAARTPRAGEVDVSP